LGNRGRGSSGVRDGVCKNKNQVGGGSDESYKKGSQNLTNTIEYRKDIHT
jgi:hypothetical protein